MTMDIDLLRTFLEVHRTRHFGRASRNLFVTQSAISSRVKQLEEQLGTQVFTRTRNDIQLTQGGKHFLKTAEAILNLWEAARKTIALATEDQPLLVIGGLPDLWDITLQAWVGTIHTRRPDWALRCENQGGEALIQGVLSNAIDVGFLYDPPDSKELMVQEVASIELVMVSSEPAVTPQEAIRNHYIQMDWGDSFHVAHARWFPELPPPALYLDRSSMALALLTTQGGSAYLAKSLVSPYLDSGALYRVVEAQSFKRSFNRVHGRANPNLPLIEEALHWMV